MNNERDVSQTNSGVGLKQTDPMFAQLQITHNISVLHIPPRYRSGSSVGPDKNKSHVWTPKWARTTTPHSFQASTPTWLCGSILYCVVIGSVLLPYVSGSLLRSLLTIPVSGKRTLSCTMCEIFPQITHWRRILELELVTEKCLGESMLASTSKKLEKMTFLQEKKLLSMSTFLK